jgi:hypothetical protein
MFAKGSLSSVPFIDVGVRSRSSRGLSNVQKVTIFCGLFWTGFQSSVRRQCSERSGSNFGNNYRGGGIDYSVAGRGGANGLSTPLIPLLFFLKEKFEERVCLLAMSGSLLNRFSLHIIPVRRTENLSTCFRSDVRNIT